MLKKLLLSGIILTFMAGLARADCVVDDPTGTPLNVRKNPSQNAPIVGALNNGITVSARTPRGDWVHVVPHEAPGKSGWVFRKYLDCPETSASEKKKTPEQACQAQALASIAKGWPGVMRGNFEVILKGNRCLVFLQAPAIFEDKRTAWLIDGKSGELLSEFYGPKDSDRGLCSYRGGRFPTKHDCSWAEYLDKVNQM
jgi:Bacterial SH3 domain